MTVEETAVTVDLSAKTMWCSIHHLSFPISKVWNKVS